MTDTPWLSEYEQRVWRAYLEATQVLWETIDRQLQRDADLSHADYEIFVRLSEAPEHRLRMSELASGLLFSRSRLSHAIARLERPGWVVREDCPTDKRGTLAVLTDAGFAKLAAAAPGHVETVRKAMIDRLTPAQLAALEDISRTLRSGKE